MTFHEKKGFLLFKSSKKSCEREEVNINQISERPKYFMIVTLAKTKT